ncbi:RES domain-containing protein [Kushneria sinocarnis]|uniref:RES domain-containing protein n=1 Tax=Kushneria sinocarnis TaxID=595502 RepID=A0A420X1M1_9GAMM|nr:RES family NAD+ phosphorylase [Kushneria sinocarnis]RKR07575.1 RES domain-containing protein [Kushneria sinocarnis]
MIELSHFASVAYRVHDPKWSFIPTSGAGAGEHGGRLNRIGLSALYLALDEATAIAEYKQLSALMPPGLIVSYEVKVTNLVDFREGFSSGWDPLWQELYCDWRRIWFNQRVEPPSWLIGDMILEAGDKGVLFPSLARPEGTNLVLFTEALTDQDRLAAYDPHGQLPRDSSSWT